MISFDAGDYRPCRLEIYDMLGRLVKSETIPAASSGKTCYRWDGADSKDNHLPSGLYFVRVNDGIESAGTKVVLLK